MAADGEIKDILDIQGLVADYAFYYDRFESERAAATFAEEGSFDLTGLGIPLLVGREAIESLFIKMHTSVLDHQIHLMGGQRIQRLEGDHASGYAFFNARSRLKTGVEADLNGYYEDEYLRTSEGWKFASRREVNLLPPMPEGQDYPDEG